MMAADAEPAPRFLRVAQLADGSRTTREIADALKIPTGQVDRALHYARAKGIAVMVASRCANTVYRGAPAISTGVARLADGSRTVEQVAIELGVDVQTVKRAARNARRGGADVKFAGQAVAPERADMIIRQLPADVRSWFLRQVPTGATVGDLLRAIVIDAHQDDVGSGAAK